MAVASVLEELGNSTCVWTEEPRKRPFLVCEGVRLKSHDSRNLWLLDAADSAKYAFSSNLYRDFDSGACGHTCCA